MAAAPQIVGLEEYLATSYSPDCEYIDGLILERNVGKGKHSYAQSRMLLMLSQLIAGRKLFALVEQRTRVSAGRVRIPDVCVVEEIEDVTTKPPVLCVEVLSPDDRWLRVNALIADYQEMGVPCVWVVDPWEAKAWIFELDQPPVEVRDGKLWSRELGIEIELSEVLLEQ